MEGASNHSRAVSSQTTSDPLALPDVEGDYLAFVLDERGEENQDGGYTQFFYIELGDKEIWKETATWESAWRVRVFRDMLKGRYGSRFKSITTTSKELLYLWGDRDTGPTFFFENGPGPRIVKPQPGADGEGTISPVPGHEPEAAGRLLAELLVGSHKAASILDALLGGTPSDALVEALGSEPLRYVRPQVAATSGCPLGLLLNWARDPSRHTRRGVALNPACPPEVLMSLGEDPDMYLALAVAKNPSTPAGMLLRLLDRHRDAWSAQDFEEAVGGNPGAPVEILEEVIRREAARDEDANAVAGCVAVNPSCPPALRQKIEDEQEVPVEDMLEMAAQVRSRVDTSPLPYADLLIRLESEDENERYTGYQALPYQSGRERRQIFDLIFQSLPGYEPEIARSLLSGIAA